MRRVLRLVQSQARRVYFRLARPLLNYLRAERAQELEGHYQRVLQELDAVCKAVAAEAARLDRARRELREEVRDELQRMNHGVVEYHAVLTQKVADELTKMNRRLETPARAA
jgi:hypothetical protein